MLRRHLWGSGPRTPWGPGRANPQRRGAGPASSLRAPRPPLVTASACQGWMGGWILGFMPVARCCGEGDFGNRLWKLFTSAVVDLPSKDERSQR